MPVGATVGAAALGAAGSLAGGLIQKSATDKASDTQLKMLEQTRGDLAPFRAAGAGATNMLMERLPDLTRPIELSQDFLESTPGYKFALTQGLKAAQNSAAARGLAKSGAAVKGATSFATGLADQTFGEQFGRELSQRDAAYNKLIGGANLGANAAAQTGQFATSTGQSVGQNTVSGGTALAAGINGATSAAGNGLNQIGGFNYANQLLKQGYAPSGFYRTGTTPIGFGSPTY